MCEKQCIDSKTLVLMQHYVFHMECLSALRPSGCTRRCVPYQGAGVGHILHVYSLHSSVHATPANDQYLHYFATSL